MLKSGLTALALSACIILPGCGIPDGIAHAVKSVNPPRKTEAAPVPATYRPEPVEPAPVTPAKGSLRSPAEAPPEPVIAPTGPRAPIRAEALPPP